MLFTILIIFLVFFLLLASIVIIYFYKRFSLLRDIPFYPVTKLKNSVLTIGIIGDSWANGEKLNPYLHNYLLKQNVPNRIISSGNSGGKTKDVYKNLFRNVNEQNSSMFVIKNSPKYCIVLAGTNDAITQMGSNYYSYHLIKIIKFLLHYNITPVLVSLPKVGIKIVHKQTTIIKKYRDSLSVLLNNKGKIDNIKTYRNKLMEKLDIENLKDSIILIDFDKACDGYEIGSDLYINAIHLSDKGNKKLAEFIAKELIMHVKDQQVSFHQ